MRYLLGLFFLLFCLNSYSQQNMANPATEVRAVWLTTNWQLDWPKGKTVDEQKAELEDIFDELQRQRFNVVLFQVRAQGKVFYKSTVEGASPYYNSSNGFDPLAFAIEACHARDLECHAWITTFPVERIRRSKRGAILEKKPAFYKTDKNHWFLDPGRPETKDRLVLIAKEIVTNYDVDGIHLDYIRYPDDAKKFNDTDTYRRYGQGKPKDQWRRDNVSNIVFAIYDTVKAIKKWVQVSSAPIGKYKPVNSYDWTAYESVHQDAKLWTKAGKHDLLFPMMYFDGKDFYPYVEGWVAEKNNRPVVPGLALYKLEESEKNWSVDEIKKQISFIRDKRTDGQAFFRAEQIMKNKKDVKDAILPFYQYPAKLPPLTWLANRQPQQPQNFRVTKDENGILNMEWDAPTDDRRYTYNIYWGAIDQVESDNSSRILAANLHKNSYAFPASVGEFGYYYFVTASDRYHNESDPAESVYFVHSKNVY